MDNSLRGVETARLVTFRRIEPSDVEALRAFYAELSADSRRRRFLGASGGISAYQAERFATQLGVVAILRERGAHDGALIGHVCLPRVESDVAEVALAVADAYQGLGIGHRLLDVAIGLAREAGIQRLTASMFVDNPAIHRLLLGAGLPHRRIWASGGVDGLEIELGTPAQGPSGSVPKSTSAERRRPVETGRSAHSTGPAPAIR